MLHATAVVSSVGSHPTLGLYYTLAITFVGTDVPDGAALVEESAIFGDAAPGTSDAIASAIVARVDAAALQAGFGIVDSVHISAPTVAR